jgi:hypothetical protein
MPSARKATHTPSSEVWGQRSSIPSASEQFQLQVRAQESMRVCCVRTLRPRSPASPPAPVWSR